VRFFRDVPVPGKAHRAADGRPAAI